MPNFSLRLPYLIYLSIGSLLLGVLIAPVFRDTPSEAATGASPMWAMTSEMPEMMHSTLAVPADTAPALAVRVGKDAMDGWNLTLMTENFTFTPESIGGTALPNSGHAHLYIDGAKVARLYGPHFHIPDLAPGQYEITVALSSDDHSYLAVDGMRIEARTIITQSE